MKVYRLRYSEPLIRKAVWAFWRGVIDWRYLVAWAMTLGSFLYFVSSGDRSWWIGTTGLALCLGGLFPIALYVIHYRNAMTRFRQMRSPEATFEAGDDRFRVISDLGTSELAWGALTEVWQFPDFWLLFLSRSQFITLPLAGLDVEAQEMISSRAKSHGVKVGHRSISKERIRGTTSAD